MGLRGTIRVPSDKSMTHRAFLFGAFANGETHVSRPLLGADCRSTLDAIRRLGATVTESEEVVTIHGFSAPTSGSLDCGNSGTTMRLLMGLLAGYEGSFELSGDASLSKRPMSRVATPLRAMGAVIDRDNAPLTIEGRALHAIDYALPVASAQVKSAILLAGLQARDGATVREPVLSRDHTERMLPLFGADVSVEGSGAERTVRVRPGRLNGASLSIPADPSSAAFFWAGAAIVPNSRVTTTDVCLNETRIGFLRTLERMGASVTIEREHHVGDETVGDVTVSTSALRGITIEGDAIPLQIDELPLFALVASQATSPSQVKDASELRVKETDRIRTVVGELRALGVDIRETDDGFIVHPSVIRGGRVEAHGDHRLAMMLQIARLLTDESINVEGMEAAEVSYPDFQRDLQQLMSEIE